jgi:hypothetical protein
MCNKTATAASKSTYFCASTVKECNTEKYNGLKKCVEQTINTTDSGNSSSTIDKKDTNSSGGGNNTLYIIIIIAVIVLIGISVILYFCIKKR